MGTSMIRGWRAAAEHAGVAPTTLRRLVERGTLSATVNEGVHEFDEADLAALASAGPIGLPSSAAEGAAEEPRPEVTRHSATSAVHDDERVHELLLAAARERAETERINAELDRLRAQYQLEELLALQRDQRRSRQTEKIVSRTIDVLPEKERDQVEQHLRQALLDLVDVEDEASVVAIARRTIEEARAKMEAAQQEAVQRSWSLQQQRLAEARQRAATPAAASAHAIENVSSHTASRRSRIDDILSGLASELGAFGHMPAAIAHAAHAAGHQLSQLDDRVLNGTSWPHYAARMYASTALGMPSPMPPQVWDECCGWRWLQPGD